MSSVYFACFTVPATCHPVQMQYRLSVSCQIFRIQMYRQLSSTSRGMLRQIRFAQMPSSILQQNHESTGDQSDQASSGLWAAGWRPEISSTNGIYYCAPKRKFLEVLASLCAVLSRFVASLLPCSVTAVFQLLIFCCVSIILTSKQKCCYFLCTVSS